MRLDPLQQEAEEQIVPAFALPQDCPGLRRQRRGVAGGAKQIGPGVAPERLLHRQALEACEVAAGAAAGDPGRQNRAEVALRLVHQRAERSVRPIPFEHGEFGRMKIARLAVPPDPGKLEDRPGTGDQQALHGEFRARMQPEPLAAAIGRAAFGGEGEQMHLLARRAHGAGRLHLGIASRREEGAGRLGQQGAAAQMRQAAGEAFRVPRGQQGGSSRTCCP